MEIDDILDVDQAGSEIVDGLAVNRAAEILSRDEHIQIGRDQLFTVLEQIGWVIREPVRHRLVPTGRALAHGWLIAHPIVVRLGDTGRGVVPQVRVTLDGLRTLRQHLAPPDVVPAPTLFD